MEGRPPGEVFAQQRWDEFFPRVGYVLSLSEIDARFGLQPSMPYQQANSIWTYGVGKYARGAAPPLLIKARYGEPLCWRASAMPEGSRAAQIQGPGLEPRLAGADRARVCGGLSASCASGARDCARHLRAHPSLCAAAGGASVPAFARCPPERRWSFSRRRDANH